MADNPYTEKQLMLMRLWQGNQLKRINILEGSVSSGKTWISLVLWAFWVRTMPDDPGSLYLMSARSLTTLKRNCLLLLQSLVGEKNFTFTISSKEGWLFGRHILLEGANDSQAEAKIRGLTLQGAYVDEITKVPEDFFAMLLSRLRKTGAKLIGTTNPDKPSHWLKEGYLERESELSLLSIKFLIDDNTTLPKEYIESIKKEYTGVFYSRFILGNWTLAEGLIYPMYMDAIEECPNEPPEDYRLSIDYGTMNAFAALLWEKHGNVWYASHGYYYSGRDSGTTKTDEEYGKDLTAMVMEGTQGRVSSIKTIIDPSAASFIALLRRQGLYRVISADNAVLDGIRETASAMKMGLIKIDPSIKEWKREMEGYVWDDSGGEERPVKVDDHYCDATRYFVKTMYLVPKERKKNGNVARPPVSW